MGQKGARVRGEASQPGGPAPRTPRRVCAPRRAPRPPAGAQPLARPLRHPPPAHHLPGARRPRGHLATIPHPGVAGRSAGGAGAPAREGRPSSGRGRDGTYLPWASRMAACDSAGTWPPPPSPGLETWRAGTKMAAPPNFHCYFGHSSSYFLGTRLSPCDGSGGNGTGTRLRHGGGRAEGEREREGREGRGEGMGEGSRGGGRWRGKR